MSETPDLIAAFAGITGRSFTEDADDREPNAYDAAQIDAAEEAQRDHYRGYSERELDWMADAQAADDWAARGGVA